MQHFLNLERCSCGAYRYLAVREHKKSYEIYLIHHRHFSTGEDVRKYSKLASIPKFKINIHDSRIENEQKERTIRLNLQEASVLKSVLRRIDSDTRSGREYKPLPDNLEEQLRYDSPSDLEEQHVIEASLPQGP